jgi:FixJ family two-component response regulator
MVYLIDDDASVRKALARLLTSAGHNVQTFASAREFLEKRAPCEGPACLLLDVQMPELTGPELQRELQKANAELPVVFITGHIDVPTTVRAMKQGAVEFLPKPVAESDLLRATAQALARASRERVAREERELLERRAETLTPREREVMALVVLGALNKQIADRLGTVEKTIKVHRARVMQKMEVHSVPDLVRAAERIGLSPQ